MNTTNIPSYPQGQMPGQTQWSPQNPGHGTHPYVQQQPDPANGHHNAVQNTMQFVPQYGVAHVQPMISEHTYRDQPATGSNMHAPFNQYPNTPQQQPFPSYSPMTVSPSLETTFR
jgi:hypothetical protein